MRKVLNELLGILEFSKETPLTLLPLVDGITLMKLWIIGHFVPVPAIMHWKTLHWILAWNGQQKNSPSCLDIYLVKGHSELAPTSPPSTIPTHSLFEKAFIPKECLRSLHVESCLLCYEILEHTSNKWCKSIMSKIMNKQVLLGNSWLLPRISVPVLKIN